MKTLNVRWEVTEVHEAQIEVDDDFDPDADDFYWSNFLAEEEGNESYSYTAERDMLEYEITAKEDDGRCEHGYFLTGGTGTCPMPTEEH